MPTTKEIIINIRNLMIKDKYDFYFIPTSDSHNSNYTLDMWKRVTWVSNFKGSFGEILIGLNEVILWTDGRYYSQAKKQVDQIFTVLQYSKFSNIYETLKNNIDSKKIAIDPSLITINQAKKILAICEKNNNRCIFNTNNFVDQIKYSTEKINYSYSEIIVYGKEYSGESSIVKIEKLRKDLSISAVDYIVFGSLDEISWLLNIRSFDIKFSPLVVSYLIFGKKDIFIYLPHQNLSKEILQYFTTIKVIVKRYNDFNDDLKKCSGYVWLDPSSINYSIYLSLKKKSKIYISQSPLIIRKAQKNNTEIDSAKKINKIDSIAIISFMYWIEKNWKKGIDEIKASQKILDFRSQNNLFIQPSFPTISAFGRNAAVIHYTTSLQTNKILNDSNIYLIDSGGQYLGGTTDVTRVIHLGVPNASHKKYYTLVLKGHLAIQGCVFPINTPGESLDILARYYLWKECLNYNHATGHGVGNFLCVHEGPQKISPGYSNCNLLPGMIVSNEPGIYFEDSFGIRIENLCFVKECKNNQNFHCLEDLTFVPYDRKLLDFKLLTHIEKSQINTYHEKIRKHLIPLINCEEIKNWLLEKTLPI